MKKHPLIIVASLFALVSCATSESTDSKSAFISQSTGEENETINDNEERAPADLEESEYSNFATYYFNKLNNFKTYKAITVGETKASIVTQKINVTFIKNDYSYFHNESTSTFYNSRHDCYYHENQAIYKNKGDKEYTVSTIDDYLTKYGTYPLDTAIEGLAVNDEAIISITKEKNNDLFKYKFEFDIEKATKKVKIQMKEFGKLDKEPTFSKINVVITVKGDFTPVSIDLSSKYKIKKGVNTNCSQKYTVTFSQFDEAINVPGLDEVKNLF